MFLFRFLGSLLILIGVVALVDDVTRTQAARVGVSITPLARHWAELSPQSLATAQASVRSVHPALWDPVVVKALQVPTWAAFGVAGALVCLLGRRRRRVNIFTN